jgi:predicted acylesterase/phospholipase RssA
VIEPEVKDVRWDEFGRAGELIAAGEGAARRALPALRDLLRQGIAEGAVKSQQRRFPLPSTSAQWQPLT